MQFCSFRCLQADNQKAQHAACLAVNGVYCLQLRTVVEKGARCPLETGPKEKKRGKKK